MPEMPFEPGKSGNPAGKLKGTRNKTTLAVEALLDGEAETITRKAIELAKAGDLAALRVCLDRIAPPRKDRPVLFELPPVSSAAGAARAAAALLEAVAVGDLTPAEASELSLSLARITSCDLVNEYTARSAVSALSALPPNPELPLREISSYRSASVPETRSPASMIQLVYSSFG
jgi:Family of unknown function (DUF5681)